MTPSFMEFLAKLLWELKCNKTNAATADIQQLCRIVEYGQQFTYLWGTQHISHSTQHIADSTQHLALSTQHIAYSKQHTSHSTKHIAFSTQHITHSTQHIAHSTQHIAHITQHIAHSASLLALASIRIGWGVDFPRASKAWESDMSVMNWSPLSQSVSGLKQSLISASLPLIESSDPQPPR